MAKKRVFLLDEDQIKKAIMAYLMIFRKVELKAGDKIKAEFFDSEVKVSLYTENS